MLVKLLALGGVVHAHAEDFFRPLNHRQKGDSLQRRVDGVIEIARGLRHTVTL